MSVYIGKLICSDKRRKKKYNNALVIACLLRWKCTVFVLIKCILIGGARKAGIQTKLFLDKRINEMAVVTNNNLYHSSLIRRVKV